MSRVLLTVSGTIPASIQADIATGRRPRADYLELARALDADLLDFAQARAGAGLLGRLIERTLGPHMLLAYATFRRRKRYTTLFTDGEQIGLPLALLLKLSGPLRHHHAMIVHIMSVPKKLLFLDRLGVQSHISQFLTYATAQQQFIQRRWNLPAAQVLLTPFMVDEHFFDPQRAPARPTPRPQICAVGLEARDYPTLLAAVDGQPYDVVIAAASPWARMADSSSGQELPANVTRQKFSQFELRQLYADSQIFVMTLRDVAYQAGVTALLEAMAMGKAVICTRTPGQTDVVVDGVTGLYVPPADPQALRAAIAALLADPQRAAALGRAGRERVERELGLDRYVARYAQIVAHQSGELVTTSPGEGTTSQV